jgi:hypothetical protein
MGQVSVIEEHHLRCVATKHVAGLTANFLHHTPADFGPVAKGAMPCSLG